LPPAWRANKSLERKPLCSSAPLIYDLNSHQLQSKILHLIDKQPVHLEITFGPQCKTGRFLNAGNDCIHFNTPVFLNDLAAIYPFMRIIRNHLEPVRICQMAPAVQRRELHQLEKRLQPQRAGTDRVFIKMGMEKPFVHINGFHAHPVRAGRRPVYTVQSRPPCEAPLTATQHPDFRHPGTAEPHFQTQRNARAPFAGRV